ncbi:MAG: carboxypeptidase regulatory-like domain-containing protein [Xenococcaceae cyanobacterium]
MVYETTECLDQRLRKWVSTVLGEVQVSLAAPQDASEGKGVSLYLMDLLCQPPEHDSRQVKFKILLYYLVTTWAEEPEEAHRLLSELVFATLEVLEFEVQLEPVPISVWTAFQIKPRPSFRLCIALERILHQQAAPPVIVSPIIQSSPNTSLLGFVLAANELPLVGAKVELPALKLATRTNNEGQFRFANLPATSAPKILKIKAKGREFEVTWEEGVSPLFVRLQVLEA